MTTQDSKDLIDLMTYLKQEGISVSSINWGMRGNEFVFQVLERGGKEHFYRKDVNQFVRI
jgi:hypothetical protein